MNLRRTLEQRLALLPFVGWGALLTQTFGHSRSLFRYSDVSNSPEEDFTPFRWSEQAPFLSQQILSLCVTHHGFPDLLMNQGYARLESLF